MLLLGRKAMANLDSIFQSSDILANKYPYSQSYGFSSSHVRMWELDYKGDWLLTNWCFRTVVLEKTPESPLDSTEIKPTHPKASQPWILIGRTDAEADALILWPPDAKSQLIVKDSDAGKDWGQEEKGETEDETDSMNMRFSKLRESVMHREAWFAAVHGATKSRTQLSSLNLSDCLLYFLKI